MWVSAGCRRRVRPLRTWIKVARKNLHDLKINDGIWADLIAICMKRARIHEADLDVVENEYNDDILQNAPLQPVLIKGLCVCRGVWGKSVG